MGGQDDKIRSLFANIGNFGHVWKRAAVWRFEFDISRTRTSRASRKGVLVIDTGEEGTVQGSCREQSGLSRLPLIDAGACMCDTSGVQQLKCFHEACDLEIEHMIVRQAHCTNISRL